MRTKGLEPLRNSVEPWRGFAFIGLVAFIFLIFVSRLFALQVLEQDEWVEQADINRTNELSIPTLRGVILDRNGTVLASNIPSYNLVITPALLPDDDGDIEFILQEVAKLTGLPLNQGTLDEPLIPCGDNLGIAQMVAIGDSFAPYQPVQVLCDIDRDLALFIQEKSFEWPGVDIQIESLRNYPTGEVTAPIIGFLGPIPAAQEEALRALGFLPQRDKVGYAGVEFSFEDMLRGQPGRRV
ncbi:MAG: hypothetical protein OEV06_05925, partial [Anaerolineae bacterium]|nr:hypothetical protein [Anaerolineae bacterium]